MKEAILQYLKTDRSFAAGVQLYVKHGNNLCFKNTLNRQGFNDLNNQILLEELRKLAGISEFQFNSIISVPAKPVKKEIAAIVAVEPKEVTPEEKVNFIKELPEELKKTLRLREDFPFLNSKDCPDELKIMVADMISSHARYVENHKRLYDALTIEDLTEISKSVVKDYLVNRSIWEELEYYKKEGKPLGTHPIWAQQVRRQEINAMSTTDLVTLKNNLRSNVSRNKSNLKRYPESDKAASWQTNLDEYSQELVLVEEILSKR